METLGLHRGLRVDANLVTRQRGRVEGEAKRLLLEAASSSADRYRSMEIEIDVNAYICRVEMNIRDTIAIHIPRELSHSHRLS